LGALTAIAIQTCEGARNGPNAAACITTETIDAANSNRARRRKTTGGYSLLGDLKPYLGTSAAVPVCAEGHVPNQQGGRPPDLQHYWASMDYHALAAIMWMGRMEKRTLTLGHSPDPDDAFMSYGLAKGLIPSHGFEFAPIWQNIQTLNERARAVNWIERPSPSTPTLM